MSALTTEKRKRGYLDMELLRFTTAGSVDDGKSTLIGRLLYDSKAIFEDQLTALELASINRGHEHINLALLTDGLKAEREQGITIDVAYRYFATPRRKFIIGDTPGHIQYTRNMVTGASTANLAIILVDARNGVLEQTIRHSFIASLLQIPHIVVCINKMDLVDYSQETFEDICDTYMDFAAKLDVQDIRFVPISALNGDNVVLRSKNMDWFNGPTLMYILENIHIGSDLNYLDARFPVQYVIHQQTKEFPDYRAYAGRVVSGIFRVGDTVKVLPSGLISKIKKIEVFGQELKESYASQSVSFLLEDEVDISRGDMIVKENNLPEQGQDIDIKFCWLSEKPMMHRGKYVLRHTTAEVKCMVSQVLYKVNMETLERIPDGTDVKMNDIGRMLIRTQKPLFYDPYRKNRITGSVILVDEATNSTVCAGMIN